MDEQTRLHTAYADMAQQRGTDYHSPDHPGVQFMEIQKRNGVVSELVRHNLPELGGHNILEIGCGFGGMLPFLHELGADADKLFGIDLQAERIAEAKIRHPKFNFQVADAAHLPFEDEHFHIVIAFTVFSSILDPALRQQVAAEIRRVMTVPGLLLWYDMRWPNPFNPHTRPVGATEVAELFAGCQVGIRPSTLAPPLTRALAGPAPALCQRLGQTPWLCSHLIGGIRQVKAP